MFVSRLIYNLMGRNGEINTLSLHQETLTMLFDGKGNILFKLSDQNTTYRDKLARSDVANLTSLNTEISTSLIGT